MSDTYRFAGYIAAAAAVGLAALLSNRITERIKVPTPLLVLAAAAVAAKLIPAAQHPSAHTVERVVTVALVFILFDGGLHIGWTRFRAAAAPITVVGVVGTFATAAAAAAFIHVAFGIEWYAALLVATAISPTDPAVVFSVLGRREIRGRSGTILEGESGANDPVGIALMMSLISAGSLSIGAFGHVAGEFVLQMGVGTAVGILGSRVVLWFIRAVSLPSEGLYPVRTAACAAGLYAVATLAHGSGFLAVFVAGIAIGDQRAPFKREIEQFHSALSSLAEIVAFVLLGLVIDLSVLGHANVWIPGLIIGVVVAAVIRPAVVALCLIPARLARNERNFVLFAGLKGAVPILLGLLVLIARVDDAERMFGIVSVVVVFSVLVQGTLVPFVAKALKLPTTVATPKPWALGVRLRHEPEGVHRMVVTKDAPADGSSIAELHDFPEDAWISIIVRDQRLLPVRGDSVLRRGDELLVLGDPAVLVTLVALFGRAV